MPRLFRDYSRILLGKFQDYFRIISRHKAGSYITTVNVFNKQVCFAKYSLF